MSESLASNLRAASAGLVLTVLTILFGQGMGIVAVLVLLSLGMMRPPSAAKADLIA